MCRDQFVLLKSFDWGSLGLGFFTKNFLIGNIHLRRRHILGGGEGVKNWPHSSKKSVDGRGVGVKNCNKLPTSLIDRPISAPI